MRKTMLAIAAMAPLAVVAAIGLNQAAAEDRGGEADEGACTAAPLPIGSGPIDLDKIPVKPVTGPLAIKGAAGCDDDDRVGPRRVRGAQPVGVVSGEHRRGDRDD